MTKPDLAALAREFVRKAEAADDFGHRESYEALRDAVLSEPAAEADESAPILARVYKGITSEQAEELAALRTQLAAAAPLFEACHAYKDAWSKFEGETESRKSLRFKAIDWAETEAGQRWKKEQGK